MITRIYHVLPVLLAIVWAGLSSSAWGAVCAPNECAQNLVVLQLSEEQWVQTQTAEVSVSIDATLEEKAVATVRTQIMQDLNEFAKADWHITRFDRAQDSSGLQRLYVRAQASVNEALLTTIYGKADAASTPGITYRIEHIDFVPNLAEIEQAMQSIREKIYSKITEEIERLQQVFPQQSFQVHRVDFVGDVGMRPVAKRADTMAVMTESAPLSVGNKIQLTATVALMTNPMNG